MNRLILSSCVSVCFVFIATVAHAQSFDQGKDVLEQAESFYTGQCGKALTGALRRGADDAKKAKGACSVYSSCKKRCRSIRKEANKTCRGLKGKKKKACKKSARKDKRSCVKSCRKTAKSKQCKRARLALIKSLRKSSKALAKHPQCKEFAKKAAAAIRASGR